MKRLLALLLLMASAAGGAWWLDGPEAAGRLALRAGMPDLALPLLKDEHWRGVALYEAGRFEEAVEALRAAGSAAYTPRANALARAERYREAVEIYDARLYAAPHDEVARTNRQLVAPLAEAVEAVAESGEGAAADAEEGAGEGKAAVSGVMAAGARMPESEFRSQGRKHHDKQIIAADELWLETLPDDPGRYLKLRIDAERERRQAAGVAVPQDSDPW